MANLPSATSLISSYTTIVAFVMVLKTMLREVQTIASQIIPVNLQEKIISKLKKLVKLATLEDDYNLTLNIHEYNNGNGLSKNEVYEAAETYLSTKIGNSNKRLNLSKQKRDKSVSVTIDKGEAIMDSFEGIALKWVMHVAKQELSQPPMDIHGRSKENKSVELSFHKQHKEVVIGKYIPFVLKTASKVQDEKRVIKLYKLDYGHSGPGEPINLQHPSTFDTLAMEPEVKRALIDDLDRFLRRREFYRRVGKVWKRGYLLYGPPGTGKSSLVAAMANYLNFHVYDFDMAMMKHNCDFRQLLVTTANKSIIVIEDIDCSNKLQNRQPQLFGGCNPYALANIQGLYTEGSGGDQKEQLPLAGLLNFIDGLWSSCGDERIIVFTTNYKERLDPALLRPGRMDMHIHLSYLSFCGFKTLASNYLNTSSHPLFAQIEDLLKEVQITPAVVAEELMKSDDVDEVLEGFVQLLLKMKGDKQAEENSTYMKQHLSQFSGSRAISEF